MPRLIPIRYTIVDDDDFEMLCQHDWHVTQSGHVVRHEDGKAIFMHRVIMGNPAGLEVDHKNGFGTDNQKVNLRECTHAQNMKNRRVVKRGKKTSAYKGVWLDERGKWCAEIKLEGRSCKLGYYRDETFAAKVYDAAARYYFGEFANTNLKGDIALPAEEIRRLNKEGKLIL